MIQVEFTNRAKAILEKDNSVLGLAVGGSWLTKQIDEFSDLDLIIVTREKVSNNKGLMLTYAKKLGHFLSGFTGEHVGEPRVLICLYDQPLLHVDLKFLTLDELAERVETPTLLIDQDGLLEKTLASAEAKFPSPDHQWIEDRFWTWVHYALLKIGRGEYMEALDFFGFLRMVVFGPLLHLKNGNLPHGVRKVEADLPEEDLKKLLATVPNYDQASLLQSLRNAVNLYQQLRVSLFANDVQLNIDAEGAVMRYFDEIDLRNPKTS